MKERVNKPRAFLSYSYQDASFIERLESDLRRCQIEPWRDRTEIRDGKPWLDSIFEEGLELEIELQELRIQAASSTFTPPQETEEFRYIFNKLDEPRQARGTFYRSTDAGSVTVNFSFAKVLMSYVGNGHSQFDTPSFESHLKNELNDGFPAGQYTGVKLPQDFTIELTTYGFVELRESETNPWSSGYWFTPRLYRFRFWLEASNVSSLTPKVEVVSED